MGASDFSKLPHIGESLKRKEDYRFLTGAGQYTDDVVLAAQSHAVFVRSPHAHAKINSINVEAAKAAPGVLGVFTGADVAADNINGLPCGWLITSTDGQPMKEPPHPILAQGKVRYVGDHVAIVVALTQQQARDAAELVEVDYEELPVIVDPFEALKPDATVLREDLNGIMSGAHGPRRHHNHIFLWETGDKEATEQALDAAEVVAEEMVYYHRTHPCPLETCGCVASMDKVNGKLTLWGTFQAPHVVRTVASLWRQEAQNRNAQEIAKRGAELYDKLSGFVEDMESLGNRLKQAQDNYDTAFGKLYKGKGNAIRQAEMLKKLGVKPNKSLPNSLVDSANDAADME